jgi:hypothetical protein
MESDTKEGKSHAVDHFRNTPGAVASRDGEFLHPRRIHSHTSSPSRSGGFDSRYPRPQSGRLSLQARDGVAYRPSSIIQGEKTNRLGRRFVVTIPRDVFCETLFSFI